KAYEMIRYKNIYPFIDILFDLKGDDGIKYNFILHPGADPSDIKMKYPVDANLAITEGRLGMTNDFYAFSETIPASYEPQTGRSVKVDYKLSNNIIEFKIDEYDASQTLVIDPWTVLISPFTSGQDYYKCDWDNAGNVYALGAKGMEIAKFDDTGALIWLYIQAPAGTRHVDFVCRHGTEEIIYIPWWFTIKKISADGVEIASHTPPLDIDIPAETWRCEYDELNDQVILGKGGLAYGGFWMSTLSPDFTTEVLVEVLPPAGSTKEDMIWMEIDPNDSIIYAMSAAGVSDIDIYSGYGNDVVVCELPFLTSGSNFTTYGPFSELSNGNYSSYGFPESQEPNVYQGIAVNGAYIFTFDGINLKQYDKVTQTIVDSVILATSDTMGTSGIACDLCGNVYIGTDDSVLVYSDGGLLFMGGYPTDSTVIDIRINKSKMYVCGETFLSEFDLSAAFADLIMGASPTTCTTCNGTATADTTGCAGYIFDNLVWSPGGSTSFTINSLCNGWYVATGTWINSSGDTITIIDSSMVSSSGITISVIETITNVVCPGVCDGTITLIPTSGSPPYNYSIGTESNTTGEFTGLCEGTYFLTVTDAFGCVYTDTMTIGAGPDLTLNLMTLNIPTCYGFTDGSITVGTLSGDPPYDYIWDPPNGVPGGTFNNLGAGIYTVSVTDLNGCAGTTTITLTEPDSMDIDLDITHVLCEGDATGFVVLDTIIGWQGNYDLISYDWSTGPPGGIGFDSDTLLTAGQYTLAITDEYGCAQSIEFMVTQPSPLVFSQIGYNSAYCRLYDHQVGTGQVFAAATGGTPDYTYLWTELGTSPPNTSINTTWGALIPANYEITVADENGCMLTQIVTLDSVNPTAILDLSSLQLSGNLEGTAEVCITVTNVSAYFANPLNPIADTSFWLSFDYPDDNWQLFQDDDFFASFDTCYADGGLYEVCLKIQNKNGCKDSVCHLITVFDPLELTPPNIFTPNGDGVNDVFTFEFLQKGVKSFNCIIVNRWGYTMAIIDDIYKGWDGLAKSGAESRDGVYFYTYIGEAENGEPFSGQGTVQLIRN
ncbi:gliding motility-associated C-terminal domain-containing protein, partial [Crocinitomix catalasitica]|nr:gliding motility-associated C-terminal domain-containing protein [Crocinitomix catalasitica]